MKIGLSCDHGAFEYKEIVKDILTKEGHEIEDFGCHNKESVDYPDTASAVAKSVASCKNDRGITLCSTGIGASIAANKVKGIRCALCHDPVSARLTREHNDSNMLAIGQRVVGEEVMIEIVKVWLQTEFSNGERHMRRVQKIMDLEK